MQHRQEEVKRCDKFAGISAPLGVAAGSLDCILVDWMLDTCEMNW